MILKSPDTRVYTVNLFADYLVSKIHPNEESIFSIMCYTHSDLINYFEIESNGLFGKFFEDLKTTRWTCLVGMLCLGG